MASARKGRASTRPSTRAKTSAGRGIRAATSKVRSKTSINFSRSVRGK